MTRKRVGILVGVARYALWGDASPVGVWWRLANHSSEGMGALAASRLPEDDLQWPQVGDWLGCMFMFMGVPGRKML